MSELEARWRTDRSPRVFLQLADELRRAGANERAVRILQEGLAHHPDSVSGRVALGRLQLEAGDAAGAAETLERALARDPAQVVASKLLIEARIRMGDASSARERLDLYRILQERDAEIDEYERRIAAMERSERHATLEAERRSAGEAAPPATPLFDLAAPASLAPLDLAGALRAPAGRNGAAAFDDAMPFGAIHDQALAAARIHDRLRREGIFLVAAVAPSSVRDQTIVPIAEPSAAVPAEEPPAPIAFERFSTLTFAEEVERDTLEEPLADVLAEAGVEPAELAGADDLPAPPEPVAAAGERPGAPSATLARLYLDQGHLGDAEAEFRRVLAERPEDEAALAGLREVARRRAGDETVSGWAAAAAASRAPKPIGLTQRKIETLRHYLAGIRRGRESSAHVS